MNIAENIKRVRQELCLNKTDFATLLEVSRVTISRYENGERQPSYQTIKRLIEIAKKHGIVIKANEMRVDK